MRYSQLFGKTLKDIPRDASLTSHKLLYKAGYIRESTAGRYYLLPLGLQVHDKIKKVIKEEMDKGGAQEMIAPILHPKHLWEETNRTTSVGFELMSIKDRSETEFVLGGTAEEMLVDLVRKFQLSYKDLPFNLYQFSTKFRDEIRARGGLLRLREFVMKDAYSFDFDEEAFKKEYEKMKNTYTRIFKRLGLETYVVESDNGYIGGEYCHEFVVESEVGESRFFVTEDGSYASHVDVACFKRDEKNISDMEKKLEEVEAIRGTTMKDGVKLHNLPMWQQIKNIMFVNERGELILAVTRGDLDVNEVKLAKLSGSYTLRAATSEEIKAAGSEPGFISPVGLSPRVRIIGDISLRTINNGYTGANKKHRDLLNVNIDRDYKLLVEGDIAIAKEGDHAPNGQKLFAKKGIEVGNIFQLGFHYTSKMKDATFVDQDGTKKPFYMGCYGIGLARTMAAIVEKHNDKLGIMWPKVVSPFQVHLVGLSDRAEEVYNSFKDKGINILFDDRKEVSAGQKFADADLIGIPIRLIVSEKSGDKIEYKKRLDKEGKLMSIDEVLDAL